MKVHLEEIHRMELVTQLPLRGKGFDMDYRICFVTNRDENPVITIN
jgi:hypothetical protein